MTLLDYNVYFKKLKGCFMGKAIGGTLGMPLEGFVGTREITYYDPVPVGMVANDDLDLQVVWLEVLRRRGLPVNRRDLAEGWLEHMRGLPDEYGVAVKNLGTGLYPPLSGYYDNKFYAGMGAAIRTEIWAALAPGDPSLAVQMAKEDACVDHYGDGLEASVFLTALESAAYVESDRDKLIKTALSFLTPNGRLYKAFTDTKIWWDEIGDVWAVREKILQKYYRQNWTDVGINLSFILLAWYAGNGDFGASICAAAGLGHDSDCTTATLGAILGIINPGGFEERWTKPLGERLILSGCISSMHEASTIDQFCDQVADMCRNVLSYYGSEVHMTGIEKTDPANIFSWASPGCYGALEQNYCKHESLAAVRPLMVRVEYPKKVALAPGETAVFTVKTAHPGKKRWKAGLLINVPDGWKVSPSYFELQASSGREAVVSFEITAPKGRRRTPLNPLDLIFNMNGLSWSVTAGLPQTIDFLRVRWDEEPKEYPLPGVFAGAETISASGHFQHVSEGGYLFCSEFRPAELHSDVVLIVQGTRPAKVWLDGELILQHDGLEYVPAFHRSDYVAPIKGMSDTWHQIVVWVGEKGVGMTLNKPENAAVPVPGSLPLIEQRKLYDTEKLNGPEDSELFIGFASRTGWRWIWDMEWRIPQVNYVRLVTSELSASPLAVGQI